MMTGKPSFLIRHIREADVFGTQRQAREPGTTADELPSVLADWKGERSRRVPGEVSTAGATGRSDEKRNEPRAHESARASEVSSRVASGTQFSSHQ